ncbi:MAG: hypothetical protein ACOX5Z_11305 [Desulfobulbus sp.]|jgi:hypothetical protein
MANRRKRRDPPPPRRPLLRELWTAVLTHVRHHVVAYLPALVPIAFFVLAHLFGLAAALLECSGILSPEQMLHKPVVTWAVYGFLPLLLCSYVGFFVSARLILAPLAQRFPSWSAWVQQSVAAAVHALVVALALFLLLGSGLGRIAGSLTVVLGLAAGLGNWLLYRFLVAAPQERASSTVKGSSGDSSDDVRV